jgi:putative RecB family exonuclease
MPNLGALRRSVLIALRRGYVTVEHMPKASNTRAKKKLKPAGGVQETYESGTSFTHMLPNRLSPTRASEYQQCPKLFYYKTILGLPTPATVATCKGTLAHYAFEKIFDHPREERAAAKAVPYVRSHWAEISTEAEYTPIVAEGEAVVERMLAEAETLVARWFDVERPWNFDPAERELYVRAQAAGVEVHGYIDRLDKITRSDGTCTWVVSDYKTGKPPIHLPGRSENGEGPFYAQGSEPGKDREVSGPYVAKAFFGLNVYALLVKKMLDIDVEKIRLIYVQNGRREDVIYQPVDEAKLKHTEQTIKQIWNKIVQDAKRGKFDTKSGPLCAWCHFKPECPAWAEEMGSIPILNRDGEPHPR